MTGVPLLIRKAHLSHILILIALGIPQGNLYSVVEVKEGTTKPLPFLPPKLLILLLLLFTLHLYPLFSPLVPLIPFLLILSLPLYLLPQMSHLQ